MKINYLQLIALRFTYIFKCMLNNYFNEQPCYFKNTPRIRPYLPSLTDATPGKIGQNEAKRFCWTHILDGADAN